MALNRSEIRGELTPTQVLFPEPRNYAVDIGADHINASYADTVEDVYSLISRGHFGMLQAAAPGQQRFSSQLPFSRQLICYDARHPGEVICIGGIGIVEKRDAITLTVLPPNPSIPISSVVKSMVCSGVDPMGNSMHRPCPDPLGGYTVAGAFEKYQNTQKAKKVIGDKVNVPTPIVCGSFKPVSSQPSLGFMVYSVESGTLSLREQLVTDLWSSWDRLQDISAEDAYTEFTKLSALELIRQAFNVDRILNRRLYAHRQLHSGNVLVARNTHALWIADWETLQPLEKHSRAYVSSLQTSPLVAAQLYDLSLATRTVRIGSQQDFQGGLRLAYLSAILAGYEEIPLDYLSAYHEENKDIYWTLLNKNVNPVLPHSINAALDFVYNIRRDHIRQKLEEELI